MPFRFNKYTVFAIFGLVVALAWAWRYQSQPAAKPNAPAASAGAAKQAVSVELAWVQRVSLQDEAQSVGTLRSQQNVVLRPEVSGRVRALGFADGARVRKGQVLVQLDDTLQRAEVQQAQAQVSIAQANHRRNSELVAKNFVAQRVLDESAAALQVAQAQKTLADARLARTSMTAPFDAQVGMRLVNLGDYVKEGADLVNLEDTRTMLVDFRLPERYEQKVRVGQPVELTLDALPGRVFQARVQAIDPLIDVNGRAVSVRATLPNADGAALGTAATARTQQARNALVRSSSESSPLRPGMFARIRVVFGVNTAALVVPEEAIVPQGGKHFVIKAVPASQGSTTSAVAAARSTPAASAPNVSWVSMRQEVKLGVRQTGTVEIVEGVSENQAVVVAGQQRLQRDGTALRKIDLPGVPASVQPKAAALNQSHPAASVVPAPPAASSQPKP